MNFPEFFQMATDRGPYGFQVEFATAASLPDLFEAPTGSGKTATAVLGWLWRRRHGSATQRAEAGRRLVFCLPMRTLVEQTERAVLTWRDRLGLNGALGVHVLLGGRVDEVWDEHPERDAILIGTQDQLLSRALMRGYAMSRYRWPMHFALLNNDCTWVMDEVQLMGVGASTAAQLQAFREQLHTVGSVKTVWMTATLAEARLRTVDVKRAFIRQPFDTNEPSLLRRLQAHKALTRANASIAKKSSLSALAKEIAAAHEPETLTLVIVNRVVRAQELRGLLANAGLEAVSLVHSRFRPADRRRIQEAALNGSFKGVLVATQAIEAGVDVSAKTLFTELAPWPSLVQRFGRLNRAGEHTRSRAIWIDLDTDDADTCLPYESAALSSARKRLERLEDVGPRSLSVVPRDAEEVTLPVIRRKDLLELFDTEPDLAGHDIDVSRFVRATGDRDIQVAWRRIGKDGPSENSADLQRDELCSVPLDAFKRLTKDRKIWRFDSLHRRWEGIERELLFPGLVVLVDVEVGGYDAELGFTGDKKHQPAAIDVVGPLPDADEADPLTYGCSEYVTLRQHAEDTAEQMTLLLKELMPLVAQVVTKEELLEVARWHDAGKAHEAFQTMLVSALPAGDPRMAGGPWAKSDGRRGARNERRFFRHELVSALAWMNAGKSSLGAFLVAAHHGKVRLSIRARPGEELPSDAARGARFAHGVCEGDELPAIDLGANVLVTSQRLSLACMELGGEGGISWAQQTLQLLQALGPFRLAYLETLVRVADWRASKKRSIEEKPHV